MIRTYKYRLYPSRAQETNLWRVLDACRGLHNMALAERKHAYQLERRSVSKGILDSGWATFRQYLTYKAATHAFNLIPFWLNAEMDVFNSNFIASVKAPFSIPFWNSMAKSACLCFIVKYGRTVVKKFLATREYIRKRHSPFLFPVSAVLEIEPPNQFCIRRIISSFVLLIETQRKNCFSPFANARPDDTYTLPSPSNIPAAYAASVSFSILDMTPPLYNAPVHYTSERQKKQDLTASAGRKVAFVDPAYTSRCCSECGVVFQDFDLSTRWVTCDCGLSLDRDHNAALNILSRAGWDTPVPDNVAPLFAASRGEQGQASVRSPRL